MHRSDMIARVNQRHNPWDIVVIGGGHNGLVCAAYLAKAGKKVLVLERRHIVGGAAVTEELYPGFKFSVCSYVVSLFRPAIIRDLDLAKHGMEIIPLETAYTPLKDDPGLCRWPDYNKSRAEISRMSNGRSVSACARRGSTACSKFYTRPACAFPNSSRCQRPRRSATSAC